MLGCVRELRRSNELLLQIKCLEAQGRQQTPRTVHALLRSFWILRYLLLPQRKAESVSVLHTLVLYEIRSFRQVFVKLGGFYDLKVTWCVPCVRLCTCAGEDWQSFYRWIFSCWMQGADPWKVRMFCRHFHEAGCCPLFPTLFIFIFLPQWESGSMESTCLTFAHAQTLVEVTKHMSHMFRI